MVCVCRAITGYNHGPQGSVGQARTRSLKLNHIHKTWNPIVQELCESRGVRPNEPYGFSGRKAILNIASALVSACP